MARDGYRSITISEDLVAKIDQLREERHNGDLDDIPSRPDIIEEAVASLTGGDDA